jgi:uncharacterized membrane protein (UPF0127 family)
VHAVPHQAVHRCHRGGRHVTPGRVRFTKGCVQQGPTVRVEIVSTPEEMARGLMGRTSLARDSGMIFWMGSRGAHKFWMRQTRIPLDLIFVDRDLVVGVLTLEPMDERQHGIDRPSTTILEVNGGWAVRYGVTVGQKMTIFLD